MPLYRTSKRKKTILWFVFEVKERNLGVNSLSRKLSGVVLWLSESKVERGGIGAKPKKTP